MDERNLKLVTLAAAKHGVGVADLQAHSVNAKWVCIVLASGEKFAYLITDLEAMAEPGAEEIARLLKAEADTATGPAPKPVRPARQPRPSNTRKR